MKNPTRKPLKYNVTSDKAPSYMITRNIVKGYRVGGDYIQCLNSLFTMHNETFNAWTMVVLSLFTYLGSWWIINNYQLTWDEQLVFIVFSLANIIQMPFSVGYHTFLPISSQVFNLWRKMDVCCIFIRSIMLSFVFSYFVFSLIGSIINVVICMMVAVWGIYYVLRFPKEFSMNKIQQSLFVGVSVMCYIVPVMFAGIYDIYMFHSFTLIVQSTFIMLIITVFGSACYAFGFPDRLSPGTFDIYFNSHTCMHLSLIFSAFFEFMFLLANMVNKRIIY